MVEELNPMTLRSQLGIAITAILGLVTIVRLLQKRRINEGLFYLWMIVFVGMLIVGMSHRLQALLADLSGAYSAVSTMLLLSLGFLFGAALIYSIMITNMNAKIRDITSYVAELRLDIDSLQSDRRAAEPGE